MQFVGKNLVDSGVMADSVIPQTFVADLAKQLQLIICLH